MVACLCSDVLTAHMLIVIVVMYYVNSSMTMFRCVDHSKVVYSVLFCTMFTVVLPYLLCLML